MRSLGNLYSEATGDYGHSGQAIARELRREDARRRFIVRRRTEGATWREIAAELGGKIRHGSVQSAFLLAMQAVWKRLNGAPRYHLTGRARQELPAPRPRRA